MKTEPIKKTELSKPFISDSLLDECIKYIDHNLYDKNWHDQFGSKYASDWNAIIIKPTGKFDEFTSNDAIRFFKESGWNCFFSSAYDARGPHYCFYFHKSQFSV